VALVPGTAVIAMIVRPAHETTFFMTHLAREFRYAALSFAS
jgi:hypothetical protein